MTRSPKIRRPFARPALPGVNATLDSSDFPAPVPPSSLVRLVRRSDEGKTLHVSLVRDRTGAVVANRKSLVGPQGTSVRFPAILPLPNGDTSARTLHVELRGTIVAEALPPLSR